MYFTDTKVPNEEKKHECISAVNGDLQLTKYLHKPADSRVPAVKIVFKKRAFVSR